MDIAKRSIAAQTCGSIESWQTAKGPFSGAGGLRSELQGIKWRNGNVGPLQVRTQPLSHEEYETIRLTHHPAIYDVEVAELEAMRPRLRKMRDKERRLADKNGERGAGRPRLAVQAFQEPPSMHQNGSKPSPRR